MRKNLYLILAAVFPVLLMGTAAYSQSAYFQAMTNLNPIVYLPLQETVQPPIGDVETNLGSLGPVANAVYAHTGTRLNKSAAGATSDGDTAVSFGNTSGTDNGGFVAVPTTDPRTAVLTPTLTVECWVNPLQGGNPPGNNFEGILSKSGGNSDGIGGANNQGGWCLSQNYIAYLDNANLRGFDFHVFNGVGHEGAEVICPFNAVNGTWYHLVATFDGVNCRLYVNGVDEVAAGNAFQIPMVGSYVPSTWNQLQIGASRDINANRYEGSIDEVAIYTNVLSPARIAAHYTAASSATPYSATILADNPLMYYRMDSPGYTAPDPSTYPIATNYGTLPGSFFGLYGTACQPGIDGPQFSGMLDPNNGNASYGVAINGVGGNNGAAGNVPIGYDWTNGFPEYADNAAPIIITNSATDPNWVLLNPTNSFSVTAGTNRQSFSCSIWFQGRPHDWNRFQTIFGHTDDGWRLAMNGSGRIQWNPGPGGESQTPYIYDDQNWHQFVGTYDGTNVLTYVDGVLVQTATTTGSGNGSRTFAMVGGDPQYLNSGNTNYIIDDVNRPGAAGAYGMRCFSGNVAQFAFFTNVLTAGQVATLYAAANPTNAPYILAQPVTGRVNPPEGFLFFGVVAGGTQPLGYQWYYNTSSNYASATPLTTDNVKYVATTNSQMTVSNLVNSDSGYYFCVVTNNYGSVTTILASLQVNYAPVITSQTPAADFTLFQNQQANLSVTVAVETNSAVAYQWYVNGVGDPVGTNAQYVSPPVATAGTSFYCIVTNLYGSATSVTVSASALLPLPAALTNSPFGSNILALAPTAYWPMHEAGEAPTTPGNYETNYGSLGSIANGVYGDWRSDMQAALGLNLSANQPTNVSTIHGIPGAIAGSSDPAVNFFGANASEVVVPRYSPQTTLRPPFTLEAWLRPNDYQSFGIAVGEDSGNFNASGNRGGFDWLYSGTANSFSITVYNGNGGGSTEPKTTATYPPGQWYHVVTEFDGTNVSYWINGVQDPMTTGTNSAPATMNPNTWDPITIGCGRGLGANYWRGSIDEVAIYTSLLPVTEIQKHYTDGTNAAYANYSGDVLADSPLLYYRMDAPIYTPPAVSTWPVLTNYGAVGVNGVYTPNAVPAGGVGPNVRGLPVAGLSANNSLQCDGVMSFADAGFVPQDTPTGKTPFTAAAWMKGNPADAARGWQGLIGRSDSAWRLNIDGSGAGTGNANFNAGPGGGSDIGNAASAITPNDGQWHYVVGTFDGSNDTVYVDGIMTGHALNTNANISGISVDTFLGAYPNNSVYNNIFKSVAFEANATGNGNGRVLAGNICEAAFWNGTALNTNQIQALINASEMAPEIVKQPISGYANENAGFTNSVAVAGSATLSYQWYKNGQPMPVGGQTNFPPGFGPTSPNLIIYPISTNDQSLDYYVVVTNNYGSVTSSVWSINPVFTVPVFTNDILNTNLLLYAGGHASFSIFAVGAQPITLRWYSNNVVVPGANGTSYTAQNIQPANTIQTFYCVASNFVGVTTSSVATAQIITVPSVIPYSLVVMTDNPAGFWPMDETNGAILAFDYAAGNDGIYTNAAQGQPGFNANDTNRTSVLFGSTVFQNSDIYGIPTNVDFSMTNGGNSNFSVECWVKGVQQTVDAGIVTKGYGSGGEQFNLDCGSGSGGAGNAHCFRFFVRNASGTVYAVSSTNNPNDGLWHHLAGVCNETNGQVILYVDGLPVGTNTFSPGAGILSSTRSMTIGGRPSNSTTNVNDFVFAGYIQDVAVYGYALSGQQVLNHYFAADIPATIVVDVASETACQNGAAMFNTLVLATPPVGYQWYDVNTGLPISGATNTTLVVPNVQANDSYYLVATNNYGTNQTSQGVLTVISGPPQILAQPAAQYFVSKGFTLAIPVTVMGTLPMTNQWQVSDTNAAVWTNLTDNSRVSASQQVWLNMTNTQPSTLTITPAKLTDAGDYQLATTNGSGGILSSIANVIVGTYPITFNGDGVGWTANQGGTYDNPAIANGAWEGTEQAHGSETRTFFFQFPQYIGAFKASFIYQDLSGGGNVADGVTFCLQNDPRGASAIGGGGGSLAYSGITPSWALEFNIYPSYNNAASPNSGYGFQTNGIIQPTPYITPGTINLGSGDPINVTLTYLNGNMSLVMTDAVAQTSYSTATAVNLPAALGANTAYVGFTAADGGSSATQIITNFTFVNFVSENISVSNPNNAVVSWNGAIKGFTLEQNGNLTTHNWVPVPYADIVSNGLHQVVVPLNGTNQFYRLNSAD